ncbi:unnamed protein product [Cyclocybe aegerita]|uniref:Uncharacterized protein n=1 Tax=Cyclocybe aegerita TaxID=1973307 RepID=A0A8S0VZR1_CYCAE|nr:unnamed protein product [Cyclocybe aegerita]
MVFPIPSTQIRPFVDLSRGYEKPEYQETFSKSLVFKSTPPFFYLRRHTTHPAMPVHFDIASHPSKPVSSSHYPLANPDHLLQQTWGAAGESGANKYQELLQSSFARSDLSRIQPRQNGLIDTVVEAYCRHHHLVLRPDDVWTAILCQFNLYVNAHSEELRAHFVAHEDKKTLTVRASGTRYTVDFGNMARQMAEEIHKNVVDEKLKDWILPDFTTTSHHDTVVAAVMMMATLKAYFDYVFFLDCGIPSITLEGEKEDWENILRRLDKLDEFGQEPTAWARMLRPILKRFVDAFDGGKRDAEFWGRICHYEEVLGLPTSAAGSRPFATGTPRARASRDRMIRGYKLTACGTTPLTLNLSRLVTARWTCSSSTTAINLSA